MSEERRQLRAAVRAAIERHGGVREHLGRGPDLDLWRTLAGEVGVSGLLAPERVGGAGASYADAGVVFEEAGRVLASVPLLSTVGLATSVLLAVDDTTAADGPLGRIAEGAVASIAMGTGVSAEYRDGDWLLSGTADFVVDAAVADLLLVSACTTEAPGLFVVQPGARGSCARTLDSLDLTRPLCSVEFEGTPAAVVALGEPAERALSVGLDLATALWAVESVAAMRHCLTAAVDYAKQRVQFDRKIGSFQAIKHKLVDVLLDVEMAQSVADLAVDAADNFRRDPAEHTRIALGVAASSAKATCAEAFLFAAEETLHVFGGIGFTWEHDAHLYYRRAKFGELYMGTADEHRERVAQLSGLGKDCPR